MTRSVNAGVLVSRAFLRRIWCVSWNGSGLKMPGAGPVRTKLMRAGSNQSRFRRGGRRRGRRGRLRQRIRGECAHLSRLNYFSPSQF